MQSRPDGILAKKIAYIIKKKLSMSLLLYFGLFVNSVTNKKCSSHLRPSLTCLNTVYILINATKRLLFHIVLLF